MRLPPQPRVIGFDDGPAPHRAGASVPLAGVVCSATRFEGLVWGRVRRDGWNATETLCRLLLPGKFLPQLHLVLLDGLTFGGFNVVDLAELSARLRRPCVALMRRPPDLPAVDRALGLLPGAARRRARLARAGPIHQLGGFVFQVQGAEPGDIARVLPRLTDRGHVPEALRLAHLVAAAVMRGESGRRA